MLAHSCANKKTSLKAALLDQRVVAGLGNIYVCEALFRSHLSPRRLAATLATKAGQRKGVAGGEPTDHAGRLVNAIHSVLNQAIKAGGSSISDHRQTSGELGYFQHSFQVYDREGEKCQTKGCHGIVRRFVQKRPLDLLVPEMSEITRTPTLQTARLILRPLAVSDAPAIQRHFNNWNIIQHLASVVPWPYPDDGAETFISRELEKVAAGEEIYNWMLVLRGGDGEAIGNIRFRPRSDNEKGNRGFWLAERY